MEAKHFIQVFIKSEKDLPKDKLAKYHCITESGNYYYLFGSTICNDSFLIDWYLMPVEQPTISDEEIRDFINGLKLEPESQWDDTFLPAVKAGAKIGIKWYREELNKK